MTNSSLRKIPNDNQNENGAVLVLMAFVVVVLLALTALAIDTNLGFASKNQAQKYAQIAALAAIEEYFSIYCKQSETFDECHQKRMGYAKERAEEVSIGNRILSDSKSNATFDDDALIGAKLIAGRWEMEDDLCGEGAAPCFRELPLYPEETTPNAFKVEGSFYFGLTSAFAKAMFHVDRLSYSVSATSTLSPRRGCFMVDISASAVRQSHTQWRDHPDPSTNPDDPACGQGHEYAYALHSYNGEVIGSHYRKTWDWLEANYPMRDDATCGELIEPYCAVPDTPKGTPHCASDYVKKLLFDDEDYEADMAYQREGMTMKFSDYHPSPENFPSISEDQWYLVDGIEDPEALTSIMSSLNYALNKFKERRVVGDKACIIFYDQSLSWTRIVNLTDDFNYLLHITDFGMDIPLSDDPDPALLSMTEEQYYNVTGRELAIRHGLFPRTGSLTNMYSALQESLRQFESDTDLSVPSSDFVVSIGDGLTNCPDGEACNNNYNKHSKAMDQIYELVDTSFIPGNIPIHVFMIGDQVKPHTVNMLKEDGESCKSDKEYRQEFEERGYMHGFTKGYATQNETRNSFSDPTMPYYDANVEWYKVAAASQGLWAPIRPKLNDSCSRAEPLTCIDTERQENDPFCRTQQEQMLDYMDDILGENPYTVVDVG